MNVKESEVSMKCPFRGIRRYEFADIGKEELVVEREVEEFPDCYQENCPYYTYDIGPDNKYIGGCLQVEVENE